MSTAVYPYLNRSQVATPPEGFFSIFYDKDNGNLLTSKSFEGNFQPMSNPIVIDDCLCDVTKKIIDAAVCGLSKGTITAAEYESIVDNINLYYNVNIDPASGSYQTSMTNTETLFISLVLTHVLCNGGSTGTVTPTVTGGTAPYTYTYAGGVNPAALAAGSHTLTVEDANGKTKAVSFIINEPTAIAATYTSTPETGGGNDGTATVNPTGGTAPYTYLWNDGGAQTTQTATGLAAGTYECLITDANGCTFNKTGIIVA